MDLIFDTANAATRKLCKDRFQEIKQELEEREIMTKKKIEIKYLSIKKKISEPKQELTKLRKWKEVTKQYAKTRLQKLKVFKACLEETKNLLIEEFKKVMQQKRN